MAEDVKSNKVDVSDKSNMVYFWVILFCQNENLEFPFSIVNLENFKDSNFPFSLITGSLSNESRRKFFNLDRLSGKDFSIFGKIEKGKRRLVD